MLQPTRYVSRKVFRRGILVNYILSLSESSMFYLGIYVNAVYFRHSFATVTAIYRR